MQITANFATFHNRRHYVDEAVASIIDQVHTVRVHYNDYEPPDRPWNQYQSPDVTDRGKFLHIKENEIVFTCDDDIVYPDGYVEKMLKGLERHGGIVSLHGRKLKGEGLDYYTGHTAYHCMLPLTEAKCIDVPGTGVMAFYSNEFMPDLMEEDKMADVLVGLQAAHEGIPVTCLPHPPRWIQGIKTKTSIYADEKGSCQRQSELADRIFDLKS